MSINLGIVGAGIYGTYHILTFKSLKEVNKLVICDMDKKTLEKAKNKYGLDGYLSVKEMIEKEKLDAISICTPDPYHFEPLKDAIKAGVKHIFCEKPVTTSVEQAKEIEKLAKENNVNIYIDFHKRWDPAYNAIRNKILAENDTVIRGYMSLDDVIDVPTKWFNWADKSSPTWFVGIHCIDLMRYITGSEVKSVYARGTKKILKSKDIDSYDSISAILNFEDGSNWTLENSWTLPNSFPKSNDGQLIILTEKQYFKNESYRGLKTYDQNKESLPNYIFMNFEEKEVSGFGLEPMIDFVYTVEYGKNYRALLEDGIKATQVAEAIHKSVESGEVINL